MSSKKQAEKKRAVDHMPEPDNWKQVRERLRSHLSNSVDEKLERLPDKIKNDHEHFQIIRENKKANALFESSIKGFYRAPNIDETMLEDILDGDIELTDDLFFELLKETPLWLTTSPFQTRIAQWQCWASDERKEDKYMAVRKEAEKRLLHVGRALAGDRTGKSYKLPLREVLVWEYTHLQKLLESFGGDRAKWSDYINKRFPEIQEEQRESLIDCIGSTTPEIDFLAIQYDCSVESVEKMLYRKTDPQTDAPIRWTPAPYPHPELPPGMEWGEPHPLLYKSENSDDE
ncbi:MAG: hypothetical protein JEZ02_21885 [Desulfatibacillum sp.]|nr:hypothetical protein [Desulfatibacillum sp.]